MEKYSLVGCLILILYDIIYRNYVETGNLSCLSLFLLLSIQNTNNNKFIIISNLKNPVLITAQKSWKQHRSKKYPKDVVETKPSRYPEIN